MAGNAVGDGVHQNRSLSCQQQFLLAGNCIGHRQGIVSVHPLCVHVVGVHTGTDTGQELVAHGLATGLAAHAVEVVEEVEKDGRSSTHILRPQGAILVHGSHHHGLPDRSAAQCGVAHVGDDDAGLPVDALEQGCTSGDVGRTTDDGIVGHRAEGQEVGVHGTAQASVEACLPGKNLCQCSVEDEILRQILHSVVGDFFCHPKGVSSKEFLHDFFQLLLVQLGHCRVALCQNLAVASVGTEDKVVNVQVHALTDSGRLLSHGKVGGSLVVVFNAVPSTLGLEGIQHSLKLTDGHHVVQGALEPVGTIGGKLLLKVALVLVYGNVLDFQGLGLSHLFGIYKH